MIPNESDVITCFDKEGAPIYSTFDTLMNDLQTAKVRWCQEENDAEVQCREEYTSVPEGQIIPDDRNVPTFDIEASIERLQQEEPLESRCYNPSDVLLAIHQIWDDLTPDRKSELGVIKTQIIKAMDPNNHVKVHERNQHGQYNIELTLDRLEQTVGVEQLHQILGDKGRY